MPLIVGFILGLNGFETFAFDTITKVNSSEESNNEKSFEMILLNRNIILTLA